MTTVAPDYAEHMKFGDTWLPAKSGTDVAKGLSKEKGQADLWLKDAVPRTALRKCFSHDRSIWEAFEERYSAELKEQPDVLTKL